ncbi:hypothetical protein EGR_00941 [Echinococcus granulosus]|uniref:Zinc finger C2H2 type n=1 Tax=Echinococcus granulosus TaxID=6210 RepID=W6V0I1_ECHGR|nr:hypothetical protein EGR_00941 [Echinococcus granulosus]EUB64397.1 hypothetical protein EGR_00941 [Echinococcus granulosus]
MSEVCGSRIASAKSSSNGKEEEKESTRNLKRPASTGSEDASNKCSCTLQPRSRSADGYLLPRPGNPVDTGSIPNQTVTSNDINRNSLGGWPSTKKPSDIGYLLIIKEEIIYRIPIILDITRIDETKRDKNDPHERSLSIPATNENEICVMMKTCAAKNLEAALKEHFQHCDWVTILAASPLPDQVRRGLVEPDVNAEKPTTAKRPRPTPDWQVPLKKQFRPQVPSVSVSNECSTKERCNSQHLEVQPAPNSIHGGMATQGHRFQCTSSARQNSLCAMAAFAKVDEVLAVQKSRAEKSSSPAGIQRKPTQETTVAHVQIKQAQNVQPLRNPSTALDRTTLNNRDQLRNPTSESQTTHNRSMPVNQPTTGLATAAGNFAPVQSRPQRPLFSNGGAVVRHLTPLYPIHNLSSVACISNLAVQQPQQQQQQQQQQQTSGSPSQFAIRSAVVCGNCQFIPQYVTISSNQDIPMDLSVKVPLKKVPHTTSGLHNVYESPDIRVTESNGYEEGVVINLAKPKRHKTNDTPLEPSTSEGIRPTALETNSESRWKCFLCNLDFEMEWWLQKHYRGHKHVCKLLESVGGSEALQKRIKCREINSETLINEKTGKLLLHVINRLINNNNSNNRVSSN